MKAWKLFLSDLEKRIGVATVRKWLYSLKVLKFDACNLYLEAENHFEARWFEEHIRPILKKGFYNENFHKIKVHLSVKNSDFQSSYLRSKTKIEKKNQITPDPLETYLTFAFFIASEKNLMSVKLLKETADVGSSFNPIFLYGPKGSGKTHLLQATAHKFKEKNLNVFYVNAKTFTDHFVDAIRNANMQEFRKAYRNLDVLIVDDIQILSKKFATQEEFFHTFNTLHSNNKTIILSSNTPSNGLDDIESRLISRFDWGISLYLEKLEKKELKIVLNNQASILNLYLNPQIEKFIIDNFKSIISIKKALKTLALNEHLENQKHLELNKIKNYLSPLIEEEKESFLNHDIIISEVSSYFGITSKDILGRSQTKESSLPRQFSMYLCRELLKMPYMKIGKIFSRDHSTVMTSVKYIKKDLELKSADIYSAFMEVTKKLNNFS